MKILIVEDEKILSKALNIEILNSGFEVYSAYDGLSGIADAQKILPDLIILDLVLPEMDGFEFIHKVRITPETEKIPIMVLSNLGQEKDIQKAMALGANGYFIKTSVDLSEIVMNIKKLLNI
jgi:DNA-binding response OmpR family regulator